MLLLLVLPREGQFGGIRNKVTHCGTWWWGELGAPLRGASPWYPLEIHFSVFGFRPVKGDNSGSFHFFCWVMCLPRNSTIAHVRISMEYVYAYCRHVCGYMCVCVFIYVYVCMFVYVWVYVYMYMQMCACICTVCMCIWVYVGECVYIHASVWVRTCVSVYMYACTQSVYMHVHEVKHPREMSMGASCQMWWIHELLSVLKHYLIVRTLLPFEDLKVPSPFMVLR